MRRAILAFLLASLVFVLTTPRALFAKDPIGGKSLRKASTPPFDDEDSFVDSKHLPLEEEL